MRRAQGATILVQQKRTIPLGLKLELEWNTYLVVLPRQREANTLEKSPLKEIMLDGAKKILRLISCATYIFQTIHGSTCNYLL